MTFSIIIASYGTDRWKRLGDRRAYPSAEAQHAHEIIRLHEPNGTIAFVRNRAAVRATGDWLVFLDADDQLAPGYIHAMTEFAADNSLLTPRVQYVTKSSRRQEPPKFWPEVPLSTANWMVIGTAIPRTLFHQIGGFDDREDYGAYEDYALWIKATKAGATPVKVPDAVYIAHYEQNSRHREPPHDVRAMWHYAIGRDHYPDIYNEQWLRRFGPRTRTPR